MVGFGTARWAGLSRVGSVIFLTVGTQLPFNRLTRVVDAWCARSGRGSDVFGQMGRLGTDDYRPSAFTWVESLTPDEFDQHIAKARLVISHAGMGSIIAALDCCAPILILPRRASLGEQRSDHQVATARRFADRPGVLTATEAEDIPDLIDQSLARPDQPKPIAPPPFADDALIDALRRLIQSR